MIMLLYFCAALSDCPQCRVSVISQPSASVCTCTLKPTLITAILYFIYYTENTSPVENKIKCLYMCGVDCFIWKADVSI